MSEQTQATAENGSPDQGSPDRNAAYGDAAYSDDEVFVPLESREMSPAEQAVVEAMKDVVDPELGIDVVNLGLVYGVTVAEDNVATLDMTLTSAACPLTDVIEDQTRTALLGGPDGGVVSDFRINWVWMPPWDLSRISDEGREMLRMLGFNV
jgi:metal-sulfur cluster biosynthetic enzyme